MLPVGAVARCKSNRRAALTFDPAARAPHRAAILARFVPAPQHDYSAILVRLPTSRSDADSRLTAFGRCEYSPPASTGTGHVLHFANEFFQSGGCLRRDLGGASARQRARVPCRRYPVGRLPHRAGAHVHGAPGRGADRRTPPHSRVPFASARRREGHHRTDAGWRHRSQPHQCRADRIIDPGGQRARAAVFVPLVRPSSQGARSIDGAENNWPSYVTTGHYKLAPYYTLTEHTMGPELLVMSPRAWESLSAE